MIPSFNNFLNTKPLYYKDIDHKRVHQAYARLEPHIKQVKTVHIVGTNAKGSTGRILADLAAKSGLSVGHFSSPHIMKFNERLYLNGSDISASDLEAAHKKLFSILGQEMSEFLSYFEYSTLLAFVAFEHCNLLVLEAGLGGEFDATNVCDKVLSIITPIGIDHQNFLGDSIMEIAATKIRSIQKQALLAPQVYDEVLSVAKEIAKEKNAQLFVSSKISTDRMLNLKKIAKEKNWGAYLIDNAHVALQALDILGIKYDINALLEIVLFGRFYTLTKNVRIDVGHNTLAATAIEKALDEKVVLIYNSLGDKDYKKIFKILKPKIKRVEILPIQAQGAANTEEIKKALKKVGLKYKYFDNIIDKNEKYLVFGSFYVVEAFLKKVKINVPK